MKLYSITMAMLIIVVLLYVPPNSSAAATERVWTSTADFDAGDSETGVDYGVGTGYDQPIFSYISKPSAIYVSAVDRTYVAFQGQTTYLLAYMTYFDHASDTWATPVAIGPTYDPLVDGHGAPSFWVDSNGFIIVMWGSHATAQKLSRSSSPYVISSWDALPDPCAPPSCTSTYPSLFSYGGKIYFYHRNGFAQGGDWMFNTTTDSGTTWTSGQVFVENDFPNGTYFGGHVLSGSSLWYTFANYTEADFTRRHVYACRWELTNDTQYGASGVFLGPSVDRTEAHESCLVASSGTEYTGWAAIVLNSAGNPFVLWSQGTTNENIEFRSSFWDGSAWSSPVQFASTDAGSNYGTLFYRSDNNIEAYVTTGGFRELESGTDDFGGTLERWVWNGTAWTIPSTNSTIISEGVSGIPVNRPFVPINAHSELEIVFDAWVPNTLGAGLEQKYGFNTNGREQVIGRVYGWGIEGLLINDAISSVAPGVHTSTDNPDIASGMFQLANARKDLFSYEGPPSREMNNHAFWQEMRTGDGGGTIFANVTGGKLVINAKNNASPGRLGDSMISKFAVGGAADVRIKFEETEPGTGVVLYGICLWNQSESCDSVGVFEGWYGNETTFGSTGVLYRHIVGVNGAIETFKNINGAGNVDVGVGVPVTCNPCWMRITRTTNLTVFNTSYSLDGTSFVQTHSVYLPELGIYDPMHVSFSAACNACNSGNWTISIDDWNLNTGTLYNVWRKHGIWRSALVDYTENYIVPNTFRVNFTVSANSSRWVDSVAILDSSNRTLWSDDTNRVESFNVTIPTSFYSAFRTDWKVQVRLVGEGAGSVQVEEIAVTESFFFTFAERIIQYGWMPTIFFFILGLALFIALMIRRRRRDD